MKVHQLHTAVRLAVLGVAMSGLAACASAQSEASRPPVQQVDSKQSGDTPVTPPAPAAKSNSTVAELQSLIQNRQVSELRTTYNGTYGASLLFKADDLTYYAALFQQKDFWRVVQTTSEKQAESTYRAFAQQSAELAEVDIKRIKLQAEYARSERLLATRSSELATLQADQSLRRQQEQQVAARQEQSRQQAAALSQQQQQLRKELSAMQRQIDALQAQQAELERDGATAARKKARK